MSPVLPGISMTRIRSRRLETRVLANQPLDGPTIQTEDRGRVLFLHGNVASATYWEEALLGLPPHFVGVAPDQRGYGFSDRQAWIDANGGFSDWVEDAIALADWLGWSRFHLVGHSLGGCVAWGVLARHAERLLSVTLVATGPPGGFGATRGERGELIHPDGAGSGAGLVHPLLVQFLAAKNPGDGDQLFAPVAVMQRLFWKPPFTPPRFQAFLDAMMQVHLGERQFPGDWVRSSHWPGFAPGRYGPINAISPRHNQWVLPSLASHDRRPRILWIHGDSDLVVSDSPVSDVGTQGKLGLRPDWPGEAAFPPQPMITQIRWALEQYQLRGGQVTEIVVSGCGHIPFLEKPNEFQGLLAEHLRG